MSSVNGGPAATSTPNPTALVQGRPIPVTQNYNFASNDDGQVFDCNSASALVLTIPKGLTWSKGVVVQLPVSAVSVTVQGDGVVVLLNGATTAIAKTLSTTLRQITITPRSAPDSYEVTPGS